MPRTPTPPASPVLETPPGKGSPAAGPATAPKPGSRVRVSLVRDRPLWCHTQSLLLSPGSEPEMIVDKWVLANLERGNLTVV